MKKGRIVADGRCDEVVTDENLLNLYNAQVSVVRLDGFPSVCVPQNICRCGEVNKMNAKAPDLSQAGLPFNTWVS